jgi:hypothetical protein
LQKWALFAEVASAIAVVITLGFVAVEMRGNTNAIQAQTYQELMQQINDYRVILLDHPERHGLRARMETEGWQALTRAEQQRLRLPTQILWAVYETAYYSNERGILGEREWSRFEEGICRNRRAQDPLWDPPGPQSTSMDNLLTPEFVSYVEATC